MTAVVSLINDRELKKLRGYVDNFLRFESEVQETVNSLYKKHQSGTKPAEAFLLSRIQMNTLVEPEIKDWMKMIFRRLSPRMRPRNPWIIEFQRDLSPVIFEGIKQTILKKLSSYGVAAITQEKTADIVLFTAHKRLLRDLSLLSGMRKDEILLYFKKVARGVRKGTAEVTVSEEEPFL